jgi:ribonucleoside-diphosphate reductase alpha chain
MLTEWQEADEESYKEFLTKMPKNVDWSLLQEFEKEDTTSGGRELACTAGVCEIVDIEAA